MMKLFKKILIANRGEIAVRVIKSAHKLGIATVAVYADADKHSLHVRSADEAYPLGGNELISTYLDTEKIVALAKKSGCDAIHPGYGFLSESPALVQACADNNLIFIGPHARAILLMGNKIEARKFVEAIGVPMTKGITGSIDSLLAQAVNLPFPVLVKAAAGGGGKGMRIVYHQEELPDVLEATSREAKSYFGDETVYIEQYVEEPRHIEIQLLGDNHGNLVHLYERECSIQRRYQKIIEESPSPTLNPDVREKMGEAALKIGREIGYNSAGTIEFLVDKNLNYYFLEMNTRIQVEHPVTEMVTGIDIVEEQIRVAAGNKLRYEQPQIKQTGHAIECRIYAEDPANKFLPSPGKITLLHLPQAEGVRIDTAIDRPEVIQSFYDPMISKLITWSPDRLQAITKMKEMLEGFVLQGIQTNIPYLIQLVQHEAFINNHISTKFCDDHTDELVEGLLIRKNKLLLAIPAICFYLAKSHTKKTASNIWEHIGFWRNQPVIPVDVDGNKVVLETIGISSSIKQILALNEQFSAQIISSGAGFVEVLINELPHLAYFSEDTKGQGFVTVQGNVFHVRREDVLVMPDFYELKDDGKDAGSYFAPMPGKVIKVQVAPGDEVVRGTVLLVVEAMKMENNIVATHDATVELVNVVAGDMVDTDKLLVKLHDKEN